MLISFDLSVTSLYATENSMAQASSKNSRDSQRHNSDLRRTTALAASFAEASPHCHLTVLSGMD